MKRIAFVFDVDGTIVDSQKLTEQCYIQALNEAEERGELPVGSFPELPVWGRTAEEWGCPPSVHLRKTELFAEKASALLPGWAHPMLCEAIARGHHVEILTGASQTTMEILLQTSALRRLAPSVVPIHTGLTATDKELILDGIASKFDAVHYFDDLAPDFLEARNNLYVHHPQPGPLDIAVVVLAAGRGERFCVVGETVPKPLLQVNGRQLLEYAAGSAREVTPEPIVVATERVIYAAAHDIAKAVPVHVTQRGPVASAELAAAFIPEDLPVLFLDSDVILSPGVIHKFVADALPALQSAAVLVADRDGRTGNYGGYRYNPRLLSNPEIIVEASDLCELCFVGAYLFRSWAEFKRLAAKARAEDVGEEFKFTGLLDLSDHVGLFRMPSADWTPLGTPEEFYNAR
jgi:CTP:molybdopterin cytidylyltransferase MocA